MNDARLPPLTALRAFEAAARHLSFSQAAAELNVTPAALSFQIKSLEEHLGAPVFRRLNRAVELTDAGRTLAPGCSSGFSELSRAWTATKRGLDTTSLTVTAGPAFTAKWLAPRLFDFAQKHPDIDLRFSASLRLMDFERDGIDVAIRFGMGGEDKGLFSRVLIKEWLSPMVAPSLASKLKTPSDLARETLLDDDNLQFVQPPADWAAWFRAAGVTDPPRILPRFSQADHAIDAAEAGAGAVLGRISLTAGALRDGRLVMPFPIAITTQAHYRVLCPEGMEAKPQVAAFLEWITSAVSGTTDVARDVRFVSAEDIAER
ncbi:transcriptional regulator GcvA [Tropicimonas sp. S265A]|uniref:transcriptional regulator GcvA n=1 Tax=Tropicimonas sp. S265A TaxID=3415134 RepID=UPI003C7E6B96